MCISSFTLQSEPLPPGNGGGRRHGVGHTQEGVWRRSAQLPRGHGRGEEKDWRAHQPPLQVWRQGTNHILVGDIFPLHYIELFSRSIYQSTVCIYILGSSSCVKLLCSTNIFLQDASLSLWIRYFTIKFCLPNVRSCMQGMSMILGTQTMPGWRQLSLTFMTTQVRYIYLHKPVIAAPTAVYTRRDWYLGTD